MKYAALAALVATAYAQDAAKVCADPAVAVEGFAKADCTGTKLADDKVKTVVGVNDLIKAANGKCVKVPTTPVWKDATFYKVTCTDTKITWGYFSDDKCATAKAPTANAYVDMATAACATKDWTGTALSGDILGLKVTLAKTVDAASGASTYGYALAATTLAVAASLY